MLLLPYQTTVRFGGASAACGQALNPSKDYVAVRSGNDVSLRDTGGNGLANCGAGPERDRRRGHRRPRRQGHLPRRARGPGLEQPRHAERDQRRRHRELPARGRRQGVAELVAARGAEGPGRRRALVRAHHRGRRQRLRRLRRHPQPGLRRRRGRDRPHRPGRRGDREPGRPLSGQGRRDLLLLDLRRPHREQRELLPRRDARCPTCAACPTRTRRRAGSSYHRWVRKFSRSSMQAELGSLVKGRLRSGPDRQARRLAADRQGEGHRLRRHHDDDRARAARPPRASRHLGDVQEPEADEAQEGAAGQGARPAAPRLVAGSPVGSAVGVGLDRDAVVGLPHPELVGRAAADGQPLGGPAVDLDVELEVRDRAVQRVVLGADRVGVDPGDEVLALGADPARSASPACPSARSGLRSVTRPPGSRGCARTRRGGAPRRPAPASRCRPTGSAGPRP